MIFYLQNRTREWRRKCKEDVSFFLLWAQFIFFTCVLGFFHQAYVKLIIKDGFLKGTEEESIYGHSLLLMKKKEKATMLHSYWGSLVEICCIFGYFHYKSGLFNTDMNNNARWNADIVLFQETVHCDILTYQTKKVRYTTHNRTLNKQTNRTEQNVWIKETTAY